MVAKLDSLWKHVGHKKTIVAFVGVVMGDIYFLKTNQHTINEKLYVQRGRNFVLQQVVEGVVVEQKKKLVHLHSFFIYFHRVSL